MRVHCGQRMNHRKYAQMADSSSAQKIGQERRPFDFGIVAEGSLLENW